MLLSGHVNIFLAMPQIRVTHYGVTNPVSQLVYFGNGGNAFVIPKEGKPVYGVYSFKGSGLDPATGDPRGFVSDTISKNYALLANSTSIEDVQYNGPAPGISFVRINKVCGSVWKLQLS